MKSPSMVWVGGFPSHYVRAFHREVEKRWDGKVLFVYMLSNQTVVGRQYECGSLPENHIVVQEKHNRSILSILNRINPEKLFVTGHSPVPILTAIIWGLLKHKKLFYWSDTNIYDLFRKKGGMKSFILRLAKSSLLKRMYWIMYIGRANRDYCLWLCGSLVERKLHFLPYPALVSDRSKLLDNDVDKLRVLYLGRLMPVKAVDNLIRSICLLSSNERALVSVTIAGDGENKKKLMDLTADLGVSGIVQFTGAIPSDQVNDLMADNDVLVLPSHREPWGVIVNEAMASGLPVIAPYWVGSTADLLVDGYTGLSMIDNSPGEIASKLQMLIKHPEYLELMSHSCRSHVMAGGFYLQGAVDAFAPVIDES